MMCCNDWGHCLFPVFSLQLHGFSVAAGRGLLVAAVVVLSAVAGWDYVAETCSVGSKGPKR